MEDLESIYTDLIMEHNKATHNRRKLEGNIKCEYH